MQELEYNEDSNLFILNNIVIKGSYIFENDERFGFKSREISDNCISV
jgi:hypothetical protein